MLVGTGALAGFDQYAVHHWMPGLEAGGTKPSLSSGLVPYHGHHFGPVDVLISPAGFLVSLLIVVAAAILLRNRGETRLALLWIGLFLAGNAVEVLCKTVISRPALYAADNGRVVRASHFDSAFPSGHALRALLVAAVLFAVLRRRWFAALLTVWAGGVLVALLLDGIHAPTDIVGGALLAAAAMLSMPLLESVLRRRAPGRLRLWVARPVRRELSR